MTSDKGPLRWKEHSLFPYTCKGCGTKHPKGDGVYLDQSGPRTVTFDSPQCAQQGAPAEKVQKSPVTSLHSPPTSPMPFARSSDGSSQVTLTLDLQGGKSVEVMLKVRGEGVTKPSVDRLIADVSRVVMEDIS